MLPLEQQTDQYNPQYLGVTLDRELTFEAHLIKLVSKVVLRENIIQKLADPTWGVTARVLWTIADYCASTWLNCTHAKKIDSQLNRCMNLITNVIRPTPMYLLAGNAEEPSSPNLRKESCSDQIHNDILSNEDLPIRTVKK